MLIRATITTLSPWRRQRLALAPRPVTNTSSYKNEIFRQVDWHTGLAARSTILQEGYQDIEIGCMNKLLARMQHRKRQFDESPEVASRHRIEISD
jgi:hypothetical protein